MKGDFSIHVSCLIRLKVGTKIPGSFEARG